MSCNPTVGTVIAEYYTILQVKTGKVPKEINKYVSDALIIELDSKYENQSRLSIYTLKGAVPEAGNWPFLVPDGFTDVHVKKSWTPSRIKVPCGAIAYEARTPQGIRVAMIQMMAAGETALVHAATSWAGFPGLNRFFVGFKPGMEMRTEDLLEAGLELCLE
ncbi:MAG: hypothetical protein KJ077_25965 [Anaerolineae bacterium]|nr:hypothetical protein [Anaerolineae bacterium]